MTSGSLQAQEQEWTEEQQEVRAVIERFLFIAGNYDLDAMEAMMAPRLPPTRTH
jgi:hypothetical protein